eukprot:192826_1
MIIAIQWCRRGVWDGNNEADTLAKSAVDEYIKNDYKYNVVLEKSSIKHMKKKVKKQWCDLNKLEYKMQKSKNIISKNLHIWQRYDKEYAWKQDMIHLTMIDFALLNRLRTEHIHLNWYFHALIHYNYYANQKKKRNEIKYYLKCELDCCKKNNKGLCNYCHEIETVYHFIIECRKYNDIRDPFLTIVQELLNRYEIELTLENILFPPKMLAWMHRKLILDSLCHYVKQTRRLFIQL